MIDLVMCDTVDKLIEKITLESKNVVNIVGEEQLSLICEQRVKLKIYSITLVRNTYNIA